MKLLTKSEQLKNKALEREREVQEGLKLAKKVDALRELSAQEEKVLNQFRLQSLQEIQKDIEAESNKREAIKAEIKAIEDRKEYVLQSITSEIKDIEQKRKDLIALENDLKERSITVQQEELTIRQKIDDLNTKIRQNETIQQTYIQRFSEADRLCEQAQKNHQDSLVVLQSAKNKVNQLINNAEERQRYIIERENAVLKKEELLRKREIDLEKKWSLLRDRQKLLKRKKK